MLSCGVLLAVFFHLSPTTLPFGCLPTPHFLAAIGCTAETLVPTLCLEFDAASLV
jgi:hypothetical protein